METTKTQRKTQRNRKNNGKSVKCGKKTNKVVSGGFLKTVGENNKFFFESLSTQPNIDPKYQEAGIVNIIYSEGISKFRDRASRFNAYRTESFKNSIYNLAINELMEKVNVEMTKNGINKISNVKFHIEFPTTNEIVCQFTGTALRQK
jgi:hypothetical protein